MTFFNVDDADTSDTPQDESTLFGIHAGEAQADVLMSRPKPQAANPALQAASGVIPLLGKVYGGQAPGGEVSSLGKVAAGFYNMDRESLTRLQTRLFNGGFYSSTYYSKKGQSPAFGVHDDDTYKAFVAAAKAAARFRQAGADVTLDDVIDEGAEALGGRAGAGAGRTRAPLTVTLTNPADIRKVGDTVAQNLMGRALTEQEANAIVAGYQGQERSAQTAAYNTAEGGGTSTANPSAETFAEQTLRAQHPVEVGGHDARRAVDEIFQLFAGGQ